MVAKDVEKNIITVGNEQDLDLYSNRLFARDFHWIAGARNLPLSAQAKIRYRQPDQAVEIFLVEGENRIEAFFPEQQRAITSGQVLAIYDDEELIGSGIIE